MSTRVRWRRTGLWLLAWAGCAAPLMAQEAAPATAPTTAPATAPAAMTGTITAVEGIVQIRFGEKGKWQPAKVGMAVDEGAEFRTGPRSAVQFVIAPDQTITLDRLGTVKLVEAVQDKSKIKTDLGMKYGRVRYSIEAAGQDHDAVIHSPGSALAVRGTQVSLYDQPPFAPEAVCITGTAAFRNAHKHMVSFGAKGKPAAITSDSSGAAQTALAGSVLSSQALDHTDQQLRELAYLSSHPGDVFNNVVTSTTPVTDAQLPSLLSGNLDFVLRWNSPNKQPADLNIIVQTPAGERFGNPPFVLSLFPNNPNVGQLLADKLTQSTPSGGHVGLNSIGPAGIEIASFSASYPHGIYTVGAYNFVYSGQPLAAPGDVKVPFTIEAFQNGKRQPLLLNIDAVHAGTAAPVFGYVFRDSLSLGERGIAALQVGTNPPQPARATAEKKTPTAQMPVVREQPAVKETPRTPPMPR